jgi:hypothetical protein
MALSKDRDTPTRAGTDFSDPAAANARIYAGGLVALNAAGDAVAASAVAAQRTRGVAQAAVDNTGGAAGDKTVATRRGTYRFKNSAAGDLIARADIGNACYVVDDETVAKTNGSGARPVAGTIRDVDAAGVWVEI